MNSADPSPRLLRWTAPSLLLAGLAVSVGVAWYAATRSGTDIFFKVFALLAIVTIAMSVILGWLLRLSARQVQRANEALAEARASEQRFSDLVELTSDWYWEQDAQFRFTHIAGGVFNKGNFRVAEAIGKTRWDLPILGSDEASWAEHRLQLERHEPFQDFTYRIRAAGDEVRWYTISGRPVFAPDGRFVGYRGTASDISGRKQAELQLRLAATVFENSREGVVITDPAGCIISVNRAFTEITGYSAQEVAGNNPRLLQSGLQDRDFYQAMWSAIDGNGYWTGEIWNRRKDGEIYPELLSITAVRDEAGKPLHYIGVFTDISEMKRAEQEIRQINESLELRVRERTAALEASNRELEAFSYSVSHDLRSPLRGIEGFAHILAEDYGDRLDDAGRGHLQRIRLASQRLSQTIDELIELARVTRAPIHRLEVDISAQFRAIALDLGEASERHPDIVVAEHISAQADPALLQVVLENLLGNAWKFTGRTENARIELGMTIIDGERVFYVRDNGAGFDPTYADNLFKPFKRLHRPDEFAGSGIGLATVQRIILRHGGRVWAEGRPNEGATFSFTLP